MTERMLPREPEELNTKLCRLDRLGTPQFRMWADQIKGAVAVEEYASRFTQLRRSGDGTYRGTCPVHPGADNDTSFHVLPEIRGWVCYTRGCHMNDRNGRTTPADVLHLCKLKEYCSDLREAAWTLSTYYDLSMPQKTASRLSRQDEKDKTKKLLKRSFADTYQRRFFRWFMADAVYDVMREIEDEEQLEEELKRIYQSLRPAAEYCAAKRVKRHG